MAAKSARPLNPTKYHCVISVCRPLTLSLSDRMASVLEPIYTLFEMGMAFVESFRATTNLQDSVGNFITDWEEFSEGRRKRACTTL